MMVGRKSIKKQNGYPVIIYMYKERTSIELWSVAGAMNEDELLKYLDKNESIGVYKFVGRKWRK